VNILIVEDEILVAADLEATIEELGHTSVGIAPDLATAVRLGASSPDLALVDLNLRDGETGPEAGARLARAGVAVIFVTGNPRVIADGVPGTLGVFTKPLNQQTVASIIEYAAAVKGGHHSAPAPSGLILFNDRPA
jgi:two-component system, response regulator PdtaR